MFDTLSKQTLSEIAADLQQHVPGDTTYIARVGQLLRSLVANEIATRPDDHPMEVKPEPPAEDSTAQADWDDANPTPPANDPDGPQYDTDVPVDPNPQPLPPPLRGVQTARPLAADAQARR